MMAQVSAQPAADAAHRIAEALVAAVAERGRGSLAVSGGSTAPRMLGALADENLPWDRLTLYQVDERVAPDGDPARNANQLSVFEHLPIVVHPMPVTEADLAAAARRYGAILPSALDVVHLGIGGDGHTASWPPDVDVPIVSSERVEVVPAFNGWERMTLTARVVNSARQRVVLVTGGSKAEVLRQWRAGDRTLPIAHLREEDTVLVADADAARGLAE